MNTATTLQVPKPRPEAKYRSRLDERTRSVRVKKP
jgi:hypothetical protein